MIEQKYIDRALGRIEKTETCWLYTGTLNQGGYSFVSTQKNGKKKNYLLHRVFYELHKGQIPENFVIDHLCRVRNCVNPEHLEAVSNTENILRGVGAPALNSTKTHCARGHELSGYNLKFITNKKCPPGKMWRECRKCCSIRSWASFCKRSGRATI